MAGPVISDVPDKYDVVFQLNDGTTYGFLFADSVESNLPFRTHKALYSYSPTFLERQNVSDQYGDNFQDFFLTGAQDDFSLGEGQKFFKVADQDRSRRYWAGLNVEPTAVPGNVTLTPSLSSAALSSTANCAVTQTLSGWYVLGATNLYSLDDTGTIATIGAHGLGTTPTSIVIDNDQNSYYCGGAAGTGIRKYNSNSNAFSSFASTKTDSLVFLNNILYGYQESIDSLISFDTAGNATTQFQWKGADGTASTAGNTQVLRMVPMGGSIYLLRYGTVQPELWKYDGSGVQMVGTFPPDFAITDMCQNNGILFVAGYKLFNNTDYGQVYYYVNGSIGKLWESSTSNTGLETYVAPFGNGVVFNDVTTNKLLQYDLSLGGVRTIANLGFGLGLAGSPPQIITSGSAVLVLNGASSKIYGSVGGTNYNSTGYVQTSQYTFDNTLTKLFRAVKVDADLPANTSIDLAYQLDGCGGSYTNLQTGATSGVEYTLPASTAAHSISVRVTLNSATGAATPTLKRLYIRAAPTLQQFRRREFLFDLSGGYREELGKSARRNRDGTVYPYDPMTAANNLKTVATQTVPFTVADRFATAGFTVLADLQQNQEGYDGFAIYEIRPGTYIGRINLREV